MKNKGFTLMELLAVIVILAIIALIAVPIVLTIIRDSNKETNKRSVDMYAKAVENAITQYQMKENKTPTTKKEIEDYIQLDKKNIDCDVNLNKDGSIYVHNCKKNNKKIEYIYGKLPKYKNGEEVYFDVLNGKMCSKEIYENSFDSTINDYLNSKTGYNGINGTGNQNSCLKFYAFNDNGGETLNLLLDHNTTATIEWINQEDFNSAGGIITDNLKQDSACRFENICIGNNIGPVTLLKQLYEDTKLWSDKIKTPKDYIMNQTSQPSEANYTLEYSKPIKGEIKPYRARLIKAQEIAQIIGADKTLNWDESSSRTGFYLDGLKGFDENWTTQVVGKDKEIKESEYHWLFDRTKGCISYGCKIEDILTSGYWTATSNPKDSTRAWYIDNYGRIESYGIPIKEKNIYGIRPVIIVSKLDI